ncbi:MAG: hypothetical protein ACKO1H_06375, partial [Tabrizicola sp.]
MTDLSASDAPPLGALARLLRRPMALFGLLVIAMVVAGAVFAPWLGDRRGDRHSARPDCATRRQTGHPNHHKPGVTFAKGFDF